MNKIVNGLFIFLLIVPFLVNAQKDVTVNFKTVSDVAGNPPPNFVLDTGTNLAVKYFYDNYSRLKGINNYFFITNTGGAGIINVEIKVDEFTEYKQFTVEGSTSYALVTSVPVWVQSGTSMDLSTELPGLPLPRTLNGAYATGLSATTLDPGEAPRDWYWYDRYDYEAWDYENITFGDNIFAVVGDNGKIITSSDGENWAVKNSGTNEDLSGVAFGNGLWFVTAWDGFIYTSENTETWTERIQVSEWLSGAAYGNGRYVTVGGAIYTSVDGTTWNEAGSGSYNFSGISYLNNTFYAVGDGIYTSANGTSWTQVLPPPSNTHISGIANGNGVYVAVGWIWDAGRGDGVVYTSSNGSDWSQQSLNVSGIKGLDKVAFGNGKFMAVGDGGAIIESTDGVAWTAVPSGTTIQLTGVDYGNGLFVVVGMGGGTILNYGELTHIANNSSNLPEHFVLYQNYPNPFNPGTTIEYSLPQSSFTALKVYGILGETVAVLVSEELSAGHYSITWNAASLPSGIYYYRLETMGLSKTKKLILLK